MNTIIAMKLIFEGINSDNIKTVTVRASDKDGKNIGSIVCDNKQRKIFLNGNFRYINNNIYSYDEIGSYEFYFYNERFYNSLTQREKFLIEEVIDSEKEKVSDTEEYRKIDAKFLSAYIVNIILFSEFSIGEVKKKDL